MVRLTTQNSSKARPKRPIAVGDWVYLEFGNFFAPVRVTEDRGNIGHGGRRLLQVEVQDDLEQEVRRFEVLEADVLRRKPRKAKANTVVRAKPFKTRKASK